MLNCSSLNVGAFTHLAVHASSLFSMVAGLPASQFGWPHHAPGFFLWRFTHTPAYRQAGELFKKLPLEVLKCKESLIYLHSFATAHCVICFSHNRK